MDERENLFVITINLSEVLNNENETNFTMLVDNKKMTIVYELTQWIRWMFHLPDCIYLSHDNSVIHDLEDIRILKILKTFVLKRCKNFGCIHSELHKTVLKSLNFFVSYNQEEVPRLFVERLNEINQKLCSSSSGSNEHLLFTPNKSISSTQNFCKSKDKTPESAQTQSNTCLGGNSYLIGAEEFCSSDNEMIEQNLEKHRSKSQESLNIRKCQKSVVSVNKFSKTEQIKHNIDKSSDNFSNCKHDFLQNNISNDVLMSKTTNTCEKNLFSNQNSSGVHEVNSNSKTPNYDRINKSRVDNNLSSNQVSKRKFVKPFSLAEIVANLRNETQEQITDPVKDSAQKNFLTEASNKILTPEDCLESEKASNKKRKRKRKRSRAQKDKILKIEQPFTATKQFSMTNDRYTQLSRKKSSHIRFNSSEEEEENENGESQDENEVEDYKCEEIKTNSEKIECDIIKAENLLAMISKKKEILSLQDKNDNNKNLDIQMMCGTSENNNINAEDEPTVLENQNPVVLQNGLSSQKGDPSDVESFNDTFVLLKSRFSNPEIFERFY